MWWERERAEERGRRFRRRRVKKGGVTDWLSGISTFRLSTNSHLPTPFLSGATAMQTHPTRIRPSTRTPSTPSRVRNQFQISDLFDVVTLSAVILAALAIIGVLSSLALVGMCLTLWARQGFLAILALSLAVICVDIPLGDASRISPSLRFTAVVVLVGVILCWRMLQPFRWLRLRPTSN